MATNQASNDRSRADHHPNQQTQPSKSVALSEREMDELLKKEDVEFGSKPHLEKLLGPITDMKAYKIDEQAFEFPELEGNIVYQKLKQRIMKFFTVREEERRYGLTDKQKNVNHSAGIDFTFWINVNRALKRLLRQVLRCHDAKIRDKHLNKVYGWFMRRLESVGQLTGSEKQEEETFLNPAKIAENERHKEEQQDEKRLILIDEERIEKRDREMFQRKQRSVHQEIPPAKIRLEEVKRKELNAKYNEVSENTIKKLRPQTAIVGDSTATLKSNMVASQGEMTTQAQSVFEETERQIKEYLFGRFFSTNDPVVFKTQNRFEGRSNYNNYYPSSDLDEQKVERYWFQQQNRLLQEKRRDEELHQSIKDWSEAKERIQGEINRKDANWNQATKFEKARGFVRRNWSSSNFNPKNNPLDEETSSSGSEGEEILRLIGKGSQLTGKPPMAPKTAVTQRPALRFTEASQRKPLDDTEEDFLLDEDSENEGSDQVDKMSKLEAERKRKNNQGRDAKSSYGRRNGAQSATTRIVDLTDDQISYGIRPSTAIMLQQVQALNEFNKSLPKKKQNLAQPLFKSTNIGYQQVIKRDLKKKKVELITHYNPVGFIEDTYKPTSDINGGDGEKYSMVSKVRSLSRESSLKRIEQVRMHAGSLIQAKVASHHSEKDLDNIFNTSGNAKNGPISLSMYNNDNIQRKPRPYTAPIDTENNPNKNNWLKKYEKLPPVPEEGDQEIKDTRLPDFKPPANLSVPTRVAQEGYRQEQIQEIESIKNRLAQDNCPVNMLTLQKAILMPDDFEYKPGERLYPKIEMCLMPNPFPKKKKGKGKKKKKGKK